MSGLFVSRESVCIVAYVLLAGVVAWAAGPRVDLDASLLEYQRRQMAQDQPLRDAIGSLDQLRAYQAKVRENFWRVLGRRPERTPLEPQMTGVLERDGYRIEKILIQSQPGFYVPINLYVPTGRRWPMPAVLSPLGHAPAGKAHSERDNYQARFITLARKGYVVCAYDPLGQGEREPYGAKTGNHHYIQGYQCMPSGRHLALYFIWDGIRCLDYLESRPEVDVRRIACAGCSGGGALTNYIAALDERVAVAVPASWVTDSVTLSLDRGLHVESWFPGMCEPYGPGTRQLLACIAPRPLLILGNRYDAEFPPDRMEAVFRDVRKLYRQIGVAERVEYVSVPTPHGFHAPARRELYRFLNKWLGNEPVGVDEPPTRPEKATDLWCAPGGQVRNLPGAQTVFSINRRVMAELAQARAERRRRMNPEAYREFIRRGVFAATRYRSTDGPVPVVQESRGDANGGSPRRQLLIEYESGFFARAELYVGWRRACGSGVVLVADENGKGAELAGALHRAGFTVLHLHTSKTHDRLAIIAGKPRCGRWLKLLVRGSDLLRGRSDLRVSKVVAVGLGWAAALSAQMAVVVEPGRIDAVAALGGLDRIESLSERIDESHSMQMLPGMLRWFDETDLAAALAPKPLLVAGVTTKHGTALSASQLQRRYAWPRNRFERFEASGALRLKPEMLSATSIGQWLLQQE